MTGNDKSQVIVNNAQLFALINLLVVVVNSGGVGGEVPILPAIGDASDASRDPVTEGGGGDSVEREVLVVTAVERAEDVG